MISFKQKGDFSKLTAYLKRAQKGISANSLDRYGQQGVKALSAATPVDTGKTAGSWKYEIISDRNGIRIVWSNSNIQNGVPIAVILQYGHATKNGGWVQGIDYINPALRPIFEQIAEEAWREVTR